MRYERVFQIFAKCALRRVSNVAVIGGEAHAVVKECLPDACVDSIFVNYPDPPGLETLHSRENTPFASNIATQRGPLLYPYDAHRAVWVGSRQRLLSADFLTELLRILKPRCDPIPSPVPDTTPLPAAAGAKRLLAESEAAGWVREQDAGSFVLVSDSREYARDVARLFNTVPDLRAGFRSAFGEGVPFRTAVPHGQCRLGGGAAGWWTALQECTPLHFCC